MAVELIGAAGMTEELKQTYDRKMLSIAVKDTIFMNYGEKKPIPARGGKSIEFRRFERITVTDGSYTLVEGTLNLHQTQATISAVSCTISQYGMYSQISDLLEAQAFDPIVAEYSEKYGLAMAEALNILVRNEWSNATTLQYSDSATVVGTSGTGAVGSGNYLDAAELLEMKRTLRRNGARTYDANRYICFIHPDNTKDLFEDPDIVDAFQHAAARSDNNPLFTGVLGDWMGIRFIESNFLKVRSSYGMSGADIYEVMVCGKEAFGVSELSAMSARLIMHSKEIEGGALESYSTIGWKAALAVKILNNDFMGLIYCASSRTPSA